MASLKLLFYDGTLGKEQMHWHSNMRISFQLEFWLEQKKHL